MTSANKQKGQKKFCKTDFYSFTTFDLEGLQPLQLDLLVIYVNLRTESVLWTDHSAQLYCIKSAETFLFCLFVVIFSQFYYKYHG